VLHTLAYDTLRALARTALSWYYGTVEVSGLERIPATGPVFLAGNHPNALMDALVIGVLVPRRVRMLAKSTLFANPLAAAVLRGLGVIPLYRVRDQPAGADPSRNQESFRAVSEALAANAAVLIFPEGTSHDDPQLAPLRTGLARMALEARDQHHVRHLVIVPMGLVFEQKEMPRTRVLLQVGPPIALDTLPELSVHTLTHTVDRGLRDVTLNFATTHDASRISSLAHALAVLLAPVRPLGDEAHSLADVVRLTRRIARAAERVASSPSDAVTTRIAAFESRFSTLRMQLAHARLSLEDVGIAVGTRAGWRFALREGVLALLRGPIGVWGRLNHWLPLTLTRRLAVRGVRSRDEPAMRSVLLGLVFVLSFYALQTALVAALAGGWWALGYALTLVPSAGHDLRYGDRTRRARARMRAYFRFRRDPAWHAALLAECAWLRQEAGALEQLSATER
jgi:glycerol-3-phosphate O-acyltransferase / dihydroxyacetone phosphate acyltransferase